MSNGEYYAVVYGDDISHHGIKGQRWGVRRFQNDDGSLTARGEKRYYGKANKIQRDIDNASKFRKTGVKTNKGLELLSKEDVEMSVKKLEAKRNVQLDKGAEYVNKMLQRRGSNKIATGEILAESFDHMYLK